MLSLCIFPLSNLKAFCEEVLRNHANILTFIKHLASPFSICWFFPELVTAIRIFPNSSVRVHSSWFFLVCVTSPHYSLCVFFFGFLLGLSLVQPAGVTLCCRLWASHCGFSWCRAQALVTAAHRFSSCSSRAESAGSVAPQHVESSQTKNCTCDPVLVVRVLFTGHQGSTPPAPHYSLSSSLLSGLMRCSRLTLSFPGTRPGVQLSV